MSESPARTSPAAHPSVRSHSSLDHLPIEHGGGEQVGGLVGVEAQIGGADLGELAAHAQSAETERRVGARRDHDPDVVGAQLDEPLDAGVDLGVVDQVVVVDDDDERARHRLRAH